MTEDTREPISDAHRGPECHVIVVETNDPNMTTQQMADAVLDALHGTDNHDVIHVSSAGGHADLADLIHEARENRRIGWDEGRDDQYARHWGGVIGWLRHKLPDGHPLAFRRPAPAEDAEA